MSLKFKIRLKLKNRMLLFILSTTIIIFFIAVGYIGLSSRQMAYKKSRENANNIAMQSALKIEKKLNESMHSIRTLAEAFTAWEMWPDSLWQEYIHNMYYQVYKNSPQIYKLWDSWEMNKVDDDYHLSYGRYTHTYYRVDGQIWHNSKKRSLDGDPALYAKIKKEAKESIWEPYWDVFSEAGQQRKFMTSMSVPIKKDGEYIGIVAVDITMDELQRIVSEINPMQGSYAFLVSHKGVLISHPDTAAIGKKVMEVMPDYETNYRFSKKVQKGKPFAFRDMDKYLEKESFISVAPIVVGKTDTPWAVAICIPVDIITQEANHNFMVSIIVTVLGLILLSILIYLIAINISRPISYSTAMLKRIEEGDIHNIDRLEIDREDEIGEMAESMNKVVEGLNETAGFAEEIGKGNLESDFKPKSEKDVLGNALIEMRRSLQNAKEDEEKRKKEDEKQNWITNGLAKFGDILRQDNDDLSQLSFNVISNLVNYLDANQGAIFVLNDQNKDDHFYELQAAIAYDRRRYLQKEIRPGDDLVGRCAHEKATIYMTDVPEDYVEITSGMGTANPRAILIVPVMMNEVVFGVIEMASFNKFEKYQIEFVEKIGESIASTLNSVKVNQRTQQLLKESQKQREELSSQEEEMRQNLEELQATQEEAARREFELRGLINALSSSTYTVEYDLYGTITDVNETFANLVGLTKEQMVGMNHKDGIDFSEKSAEDYERFWEDLRHGISRTDINRIDYNNQEIFLKESYTPILDEDENPYKILKIGFNITEQIKAEQKLEAAQEEIEELKKQKVQDQEYLESLKEQLNEEKAQNLKIRTQLEELQQKMADSAQKASDREKDKKDNAQEAAQLPGAGQNLVDFTTEMQTGINELDEQHQRIVEMVNGLYEAFLQKAKRKNINEQLKTFVDYTSWHFSNEERYFDEYGFEEAGNHKKEHNQFIERVQSYAKKFEKDRIHQYEETMQYIKTWIEHHFTTTDQKYVSLFKSKGL